MTDACFKKIQKQLYKLKYNTWYSISGRTDHDNLLEVLRHDPIAFEVSDDLSRIRRANLSFTSLSPIPKGMEFVERRGEWDTWIEVYFNGKLISIETK